MRPLSPRAEDIEIDDIAYALAGEYRFGGHCKPRVSVAEHSVAVSRGVPPEHALWGLLHDASEAYLRDIARPVKLLPELSAYRDAEELVMRAVADRFGLSWPMPECVKIADNAALRTERDAVMRPLLPGWTTRSDPLPGYVVRSWAPHYAEITFLSRFYTLRTTQ